MIIPRELSTPELRLEKCSLLTIINVLKFNALPQNWSWTTDLVNPKNIVLCHLDKVSMNLKFRIKISEDFNISLLNLKTQESVEFNTNFSQISDFWEFLKELENCELCEGTGFNEERCSSACSGVSLPDEQYKKQMNLFRCFACRQLRRKLQNRSYKVKPDIKSSYTDLKYQESLKTKQIQRLKHKVPF
ncbi:uncharacterized protein LOC141538041 [Cotesia typhae]|uniref:uncharacterized protein LOC141538041 n=1 Tax=Cotesia typhae TaxID=2053667 RepID=UPI003D69A734